LRFLADYNKESDFGLDAIALRLNATQKWEHKVPKIHYLARKSAPLAHFLGTLTGSDRSSIKGHSKMGT